MKSNELFEKIHSGIIKNGTDIKVIYKDEEVDNIKYEAGMLQWEQSGKFSSKYLCDIETEFEIIEEEQQDIDIQGIENVAGITFNFPKDAYTAKQISDNFETMVKLLNMQSDKQNELIRAVKQLDKQINLQSSK